MTFKSNAASQSADPSVRCASYARFSCQLQRDESITDQQRVCREKAVENGHTISAQLEFSDEAISGTKLHRAGLNALIAAAENRQYDVLYVHSLSRLSRESVITLPLLKKLVYNHDIRVISATENVDSRESSWEMIAHVMAIVHEQYVKGLSVNVHRGQEGVVLAGHCVGDYCFGYASIPVPGSDAASSGRGRKPLKMYIIDTESAAWVKRIFQWFVEERRSLRWIAAELNRRGAPKDHRATTTQWTHRLTAKLLSNRKYIGQWAWSQRKNVRDPLTGKVRQVNRSPAECEKWIRQFHHLRLVDDELFERAQQLLDQNRQALQGRRKQRGQLHGSPSGATHSPPRYLLSRLIECGHCGRTFCVGGTGGKYLQCPNYAKGTCPCQTQLPRERAERMILSEIGQRVLENAHWMHRIVVEIQRAWRAEQATVPQELAAARQRLTEIDKKINNLVDRMEAGRGGPELDDRLVKRRAEKRELADRIRSLERADDCRRPEPTPLWVAEQLRDLAALFASRSPAAARALRDLVRGRIVVTEVRRAGYQRHYLQGRFTITVGAVAASLVGSPSHSSAARDVADDGPPAGIVIDFREPLVIDEQSEIAKRLYDQGWPHKDIAVHLGLSRSRVTAILKHWYTSRNLPVPDGRSLRGDRKTTPPLHQQIADEVKRLSDEGLLFGEIAQRLDVCRDLVTRAWSHWHRSRQLPVPDGRTRRKSLEHKQAVQRTPPPCGSPSDDYASAETNGHLRDRKAG